MKPIEVSTESLHYRLATVYGGMVPWRMEENIDICQYTRKVVRGFFIVLIVLFLGAVAAFFVGDALGWVTAMLMQWVYIIPELWATLVAALVIIILVFVAFLCMIYALQRVIRRPQIDHVGVVYQMYRSWKDKYCIPVKFKS